MNRFDHAAGLIAGAVASGVTPAAVAEVGRATGTLWRAPFGRLTYDAEAPATADDTFFDLASLTKVLATAPLVMRAVDRGQLRLGDPVRGYLPHWRGTDRDDVTIRDLLAHSSGLTAYLPFFRDYSGRAEFERAICALPLEYAPRTRSIYSDLGFMLLGFILEDLFGRSLASCFDELARAIATGPIGFNPPAALRPRTAPTEVDPWRGRLLAGEVHDENCWALGGAAGHAGLFGTAAAVGTFARTVLEAFRRDTALARRTTMELFARRTIDVPDSSRALGWDTMLPTSSCGTKLSARAIGHTGFTGTSLWIDPEQDLYIVLLTNRVHPTRENNRLKELRGKIHDAVLSGILGS
ncbi:MAG: beta-lactamase family protein [Acidobacteria bacterium]|nr:beta-lactamase family protein [Acidobacteriota bacterium]